MWCNYCVRPSEPEEKTQTNKIPDPPSFLSIFDHLRQQSHGILSLAFVHRSPICAPRVIIPRFDYFATSIRGRSRRVFSHQFFAGNPMENKCDSRIGILSRLLKREA